MKNTRKRKRSWKKTSLDNSIETDFKVNHHHSQMKTDQQLQKDVQDAIKWEPSLNIADIGVTANEGIVTLTGVVNSYLKKSKADDAAKNVAGVKAVLEEIEVRIMSADNKTDGEIALEVLAALKADWQVPYQKIKVNVEEGWVTLSGSVEWNYESEAAKKSVRNLEGIKVLTNAIKVQPGSADEVEQAGIERALARNWSTNDQDISVNVFGNDVTLNGTVNSYYQKDEAERIAWNAPGVFMVKNELAIAVKD